VAAAFRCRVGDYQASTALEKLGHLIAGGAAAGFATHLHQQTAAWQTQLDVVGQMVAGITERLPAARDWWLLFEYEIPRRERRPDLILLADDLVFVIEFKVGGTAFTAADEWQTYSYALDLRDFHAESKDRTILPLLVATDALASAINASGAAAQVAPGSVATTRRVNAADLARTVVASYEAVTHDPSRPIDAESWDSSAYRPTPTIIEAAEALFAGHGVADISHAFASNLDVTTGEVVSAIRSSQAGRLRTICFVTGTPGAGKTLTGLNAAHNPTLRAEGRPPAVLLSGNGPLVKIVREALVRDKRRAGVPKGEAARVVKTFVANVHQFLTHHGISDPSRPPPEHAVVFDEAQRAWDARAVAKKHGVPHSEPSLLLQIMERAPEWCTIVALVGGGQEIHNGEAGLAEWGRALAARDQRWRVMAAPDVLVGGASVAGHRLFESAPPSNVDLVESPALHLSVSVRSPRSRLIGQWVNELLSNGSTATIGPAAVAEFPVVLTRDLAAARRWLRERAEAGQRSGLLASSGALRLRAEGIEVSAGFRQGYSYADWFLGGLEDTRASSRLEVAATEFECQGLEVDWAGVCWGDDFVIDPATGRWACRTFRGTTWRKVGRAESRQFVVNKYRVLLTRARRGMVIWVPEGDPSDPTRDPSLLEATAAYLLTNGVAPLSA
jgi:hypothetical protein